MPRLTTPEVFRFICQFQSSRLTNYDALMTRRLPRSLAKPVDQRRANRQLTPWLTHFGLVRLQLLASAVPALVPVVTEYASLHGRLDILDVMREIEPFTSTELYTLAAQGGHVHVLRYLDDLGYKYNLMDAAKRSATHGHVSVLQFFHQTYPLNRWMNVHAVESAAAAGHLNAMAWLFNMWPPFLDQEMLYKTQEKCLTMVIKRSSIMMALWLVHHMQDTGNIRAVVQVLLARKGPYGLFRELNELAAVSEVLAACPSSELIETLEVIFGHFSTLQHQDTVECRVVYNLCLVHAVTHGLGDLLCWLGVTRSMYPLDIHDVLHRQGEIAFQEAIQSENVQVVLFLKGYVDTGSNGPLNPAFERKILLDGVAWTPLAKYLLEDTTSHLTSWCKTAFGHGEKESQRVVEWIELLVARQDGGRVAVMGQLLVRMAQVDDVQPIFPQLYRTWEVLVQNTQEKQRVHQVCLKHGHASVVTCISITKALVVHAVTYFELAVLQQLYASSTACEMDPDKQEDFHVEMLTTAVAACRSDAIEWMVPTLIRPSNHVLAPLLQLGLSSGFDRPELLWTATSDDNSIQVVASLVQYCLVESIQLRFDMACCLNEEELKRDPSLRGRLGGKVHTRIKKLHVLINLASAKQDLFEQCIGGDPFVLLQLSMPAPNDELERATRTRQAAQDDESIPSMSTCIFLLLTRAASHWLDKQLHSTLPTGVESSLDDSMTWFDRLLGRDGGPVILLGRCLVQRRQSCKPRMGFRKHYALWRELLRTYIDRVLQNQQVHGAMLFQAILTGRVRMVKWLINRFDDQLVEVMEDAIVTAVSCEQESIARLLRRKLHHLHFNTS
ncbi:Aste57867_24146 [Aphanomyces stellatus]|uniref:Aste57867_24146 protein n=1 Tax=Aphanomyces stellatus TaxID=120398 RepID=A0A485LPN7_9STRA|nr:hypothetical protein As57867_024072 [Aphanomyces stellatus]KAF0715281.1 hypothetical protein As57867_003439 [Aphanomyces stellatus]KAF0715301.1 hypothetical protein As57867_003459 [Aphanomyces stellatus]VFT80615.1 Aste57867_3449 [Aphanomyces stellatus]VFT80635.1 Aste57867_3469 [Aphanomyces stellatus]